ncbi:hypothetical protein PoB_006515100 [Plakobranchus ocellatus]|uniref:Uncharacterized protein n=1 Tax=Plakobranchus ocellatus TaxID=259542 RepID=A0AAV4D3J2_9GAST|nr:hypothetical protein PoB_006515100 [Plakobranchus ocellatus]
MQLVPANQNSRALILDANRLLPHCCSSCLEVGGAYAGTWNLCDSPVLWIAESGIDGFLRKRKKKVKAVGADADADADADVDASANADADTDAGADIDVIADATYDKKKNLLCDAFYRTHPSKGPIHLRRRRQLAPRLLHTIGASWCIYHHNGSSE